MNPKFLDPHAEIAQHGLRLPHWQQDGATYFVTFRLADSIPATLLEQWREERDIWLRLNPPPRSVEQGEGIFRPLPAPDRAMAR